MTTSLDFEALQDKCIKILNKNTLIVLATAYNGHVRSRTVDYINNGMQIGFLTWQDTAKMEHIKHNPRVALCVKNLQIEGQVSVLGHPSLAEHQPFMESYKERLPIPYHNFVPQDNVTLCMVEPALAIVMTYEAQHLYLDHLDLTQRTAFRKELSPWNPEASG